LEGLINQIIHQVEKSWIRPPDVRQGLICIIRVKLMTDGTVIDAEVISSSGDTMFDNSAVNAVNKASPLAVTKDKALFAKEFRPLVIKFHPK
jgi:colicin import membrane protein